MSYTPNNAQIFVAAYSGAMAGMVASGKVLTDGNAADYNILAAYAGAWAMSFDGVWGANSADSLQISLAQTMSEAVWFERTPSPTNVSNSFFTVPSFFTVRCTAIVACITSAENFFSANGIPIPGGGGGENNWRVKSGTYVLLPSDGNFLWDTSAGVGDAFLPAAGFAVGETHGFSDMKQTWNVNKLTLHGNGQNIVPPGGGPGAATVDLAESGGCVFVTWTGLVWLPTSVT